MLGNLFSRQQESPGAVEYIVAGLGNPGSKFDLTRHNAGFMAIDRIAENAGVKIDRLKFKGLCCTASIGDKKALLLKPETYMNLSGQSVVEAMNFYKIPPEKTIIIYDDISFPPGKMRIRLKGSDGGQNGMKNIIYLAGKDTFPRIKLGTGSKPNKEWDLADWVLTRFTPQELDLFYEAAEKAGKAVALIMQGKAPEAMNRYNC